MAVNMASPTRTSIVPGPHPMSTMDIPGRRYGSRYAAELAAVRHRCDRRTDSWCPCV